MSEIPGSSLLLSVRLHLSTYLRCKLCQHLHRRFLYTLSLQHTVWQALTWERSTLSSKPKPRWSLGAAHRDFLLRMQRIPSFLCTGKCTITGVVSHQWSAREGWTPGQLSQDPAGAGGHSWSAQPVRSPPAAQTSSVEWGALTSAVPCGILQWKGVWVSPPQPSSFLHLWRLQTCPSRSMFLTLGETPGPSDESYSCKVELWPEDDAHFLLLICKGMAAIKACPSFYTHVGFRPTQPQHALVRLRITPHPRHFPGTAQHLTTSHARTSCWKLLHCSAAPAATGLALHSAHW